MKFQSTNGQAPDPYAIQRGKGRISVLRAAIIEVMCDGCDVQEQWRGRSFAAIEKVAARRGWEINGNRAVCGRCVRRWRAA